MSIHDPPPCLDLSWHHGYLLLHVFQLLLQEIPLLGLIKVQTRASGSHKLVGVVGGDRGRRAGYQIGLVVQVLIRDVS